MVDHDWTSLSHRIAVSVRAACPDVDVHVEQSPFDYGYIVRFRHRWGEDYIVHRLPAVIYGVEPADYLAPVIAHIKLTRPS